MAHNFTPKQLLTLRDWYGNNPGGIINVDWLTNWNKAAFKRWFIGCLMAKINRNNPKPCYAKLSPDFQIQAKYIAIRLANRNVVRVNEVPVRLRKRLMHRLYRPNDF